MKNVNNEFKAIFTLSILIGYEFTACFFRDFYYNPLIYIEIKQQNFLKSIY